MENGEHKVSLDTLFRISSVFGMDIGEFFRDDAAIPGTPEAEQEIIRPYQRMDEPTRAEILDFIRYKSVRRVEAVKI